MPLIVVPTEEKPPEAEEEDSNRKKLSIKNLSAEDLSIGDEPQKKEDENMDICSEMEEDQGKDEPKSHLVPQFFPVFDPSQFDLSHLDMAVVLDICKALPHIEQVSFLLASKEVS